MNRRSFLLSAAATAGVALAQPVLGKVAGRRPLTRKERVDRALAGRDVDRPPFTHWHHFEPQTPEEHAKATLEYHWKYKTDIVKVMSDYPYPKPAGNWYELKVLDSPFPDQIRALELIRDGLHGDAYILETAFNPWQVAVKLSSKEEVVRLAARRPRCAYAVAYQPREARLCRGCFRDPLFDCKRQPHGALTGGLCQVQRAL